MPTLADSSPLGASVEHFLSSMQSRHLSGSALGHARRVLASFLSFMAGRLVHDARAVVEADVVAFATALVATNHAREGGLSLASQRAYLGVLKRFFAHLVDERQLLVSPARELPLPRVHALPRQLLNADQARRLVTAPPSCDPLAVRNRAILELLYGTGLRAGECARLDVIDVDLGSHTLLVRCGKGGRDRLVPLGRAAFQALGRYLREARPRLVVDPLQPALFCSAPGRWPGRQCGRNRIEVQAIEKVVRRYANAARLPANASPHMLRHACATHLLQGGADVRHVQELLGHADIATTARYTRVALGDLRRVLVRCHPRERVSARRRRRRA